MTNQIKIPAGTKIFLLEDDELMRGLLVKKFESLDSTIKVSEKGDGAFDEIKKMMPDMTLLDIQVPGGIDGLEVLRLMRADESTRDLRVIIVSNFSDKAQIDKAHKLGVVGYLVKATVSVDEIANEVAKHLSK